MSNLPNDNDMKLKQSDSWNTVSTLDSKVGKTQWNRNHAKSHSEANVLLT